VFLLIMVIGIAGLVVMALPAFARGGGVRPTHGHMPLGRGHGGAHAPHGGHALPRGAGRAGAATAARGTAGAAAKNTSSELSVAPDLQPVSLLRFVPSPRAVCSVLALYGAFANALLHAMHWTYLFAGIGAVVPALLVERFAVRPVWNLVFRFQGQPSSPLEELILTDAVAVVPFRNGRGLVAVVRDGRTVQFVATLQAGQASGPVNVGDRLCVEDVDARRERVVVSRRDS
jgi:hypothetical protein